MLQGLINWTHYRETESFSLKLYLMCKPIGPRYGPPKHFNLDN